LKFIVIELLQAARQRNIRWYFILNIIYNNNINKEKIIEMKYIKTIIKPRGNI